jgi:hypothetical protein
VTAADTCKAGKPLSIGFIADNGRYDFAKLISQNGNTFQYKMTIPTGHTSYLVVVTPLAVKDVQGANAVQNSHKNSGPCGERGLCVAGDDFWG